VILFLAGSEFLKNFNHLPHLLLMAVVLEHEKRVGQIVRFLEEVSANKRYGNCEKCAEFKKQVFREEWDMIRCTHCGKLMMSGAFDRHCWGVYYREGYRPNGKRERRR
jgi:ribosomal protein L37AE/L43A